MSRLTQNMPALGNSRGIQYTQAEMSKDLQVYHLVSKHHPNQLYESITPGYVHSIQLKDNASGLYYNKMKSLYMDELDATLIQHQNKALKAQSEAEQFKRQYREKVNPMIISMEKGSQKMKQTLNDRVERQRIRQARFIDGERVKQNKIQQFINNNEYNKLKAKSFQMYTNEFENNMKQNECIGNYNIKKGQEKTNIYKGVNTQVINKSQIGRTKQDSLYHLNGMDSLKVKQDVERGNNSVRLNRQFTSPINLEGGEKQDPNRKILRIHNPITYPLEYHIDNAYFIKGMQKMERKGL